MVYTDNFTKFKAFPYYFVGLLSFKLYKELNVILVTLEVYKIVEEMFSFKLGKIDCIDKFQVNRNEYYAKKILFYGVVLRNEYPMSHI